MKRRIQRPALLGVHRVEDLPVIERVAVIFNVPLTPEHRALIASGAEQSAEDIELARSMTEVQRQTLTGTHRIDNETIS